MRIKATAKKKQKGNLISSRHASRAQVDGWMGAAKLEKPSMSIQEICLQVDGQESGDFETIMMGKKYIFV